MIAYKDYASIELLVNGEKRKVFARPADTLLRVLREKLGPVSYTHLDVYKRQQLEALVYLLSRAVGGRPVKLVNTREQDLISSPGHIGMEADVRLGCTKEGNLVAAELTYLFDCGAYADYAVNISRAAAISSTGPYRIPNVSCDSLCVYTNHPFATAFRGFGHIELAFAIERSIDLLSEKLGMDSMEFRLKNAIVEGDTAPTSVSYTHLCV